MPSEPEPGTPDAVHRRVLDVGMMRLCGHDLAVPATNVREVVPLPERLQPSFSGFGGSIGSILVRGRAIPVLDVADRLGFPPRTEPHGVVLIMRHEAALIGIVMDSVSGLARIHADTVQPFAVAGGGDHRIVTSRFPHGDALVGLLDPAAILATAGVPSAREQTARADAGGAASRSAAVLVTLAGANIALDARTVVATVPNALLRPSPAPSSKWIGVVPYLGQDVPVVDDLALFGLSGRASDAPGGAVIILRLDAKRLIGVKIDRVHRILPISSASVRPLPGALADQLTLFRGAVVDHQGQQNLLLDGDALKDSSALAMIGALSGDKSGGASAVTEALTVQEQTQPFLVFVSGTRRRAAPLASVKQIIPLPGGRTGLARAGSALNGIASYNGAPLPLIDLSGCESAPSDMGDEAMVLVVEREGCFNGLIVERLETIARSVVHRRPCKTGDAPDSFFVNAMLNGRAEAVTLCDLGEEAARLT